MLKSEPFRIIYEQNSLEEAAISFIRNSCEGLRFDVGKALFWEEEPSDRDGKSIKAGQIPYNMEKDIDRLCMERALERFLKSGRKEDAFDVYFCYLEMFVGDYEKTRRMIELLSEYEANGSGLLMKHRDHYSHSVYVFALGLAIYESNDVFKRIYREYYQIKDDNRAACHFLEFWGMTALFHDIGYPFELPFEQVASYFEVEGDKREERPYVAYHALDSFVTLSEAAQEKVKAILKKADCTTTDAIFAHVLTEKMGEVYHFSEAGMLKILKEKPAEPNKHGHFMDHAYFSATLLFKKLFEEMDCELKKEHLDALTAILMHNSLYKFKIADYKTEGNKPFKASLHPLAYMLMLCDELQCWDRTAYGRNSKKELHPMGCRFDLSGNNIKAIYLFDKREMTKVYQFTDSYSRWQQRTQEEKEKPGPKLKAYSDMYIKTDGKSDFQSDIEKIVDLTQIRLSVDVDMTMHVHAGRKAYLSDSNFINLYHFAVVLNGRWEGIDAWKKAKNSGHEDQFLYDKEKIQAFSDSFRNISLEYKLSNINQAKAFAEYLNEIDCFYTDRDVDFELVESFEPQELLKIGVIEHQRWLQEHYDMGWEYGEPSREERDFQRQHKDMIPAFRSEDNVVSYEQAKANYERLDKAEQDKDTEPMECMLAMLKMFDGLRIYKL